MSKKPKLAVVVPLDGATRRDLISRFPPAFERVFAKQIVLQWQDVQPGHPVDRTALEVEVYGYYEGPISQVLAVTVNGSISQPDGTPLHITISAAPDVALKDARIIDPDAMVWLEPPIPLHNLRAAVHRKGPLEWEPRSAWINEGVAA
jgi:hypothetical protein